jgi:hypothetical protein
MSVCRYMYGTEAGYDLGSSVETDEYEQGHAQKYPILSKGKAG